MVARRFPFRVGRASGAGLALDDPGVWDAHFELLPAADGAITIRRLAEALVTVDGQSISEIALKHGDIIEIGAVKLRFWLAEARPRSLATREILTWLAIAALFLCQIAMIYWMQ